MAPRFSIDVVEVVDIILVRYSNEQKKHINGQFVDEIICITGKREVAVMESSMAFYCLV